MKYPASLQRSPAQMQVEVPPAHGPRTGWPATILRDRGSRAGEWDDALRPARSGARPVLIAGVGEITGPIFARILA
jgi:hypothetical protein